MGSKARRASTGQWSAMRGRTDVLVEFGRSVRSRSRRYSLRVGVRTVSVRLKACAISCSRRPAGVVGVLEYRNHRASCTLKSPQRKVPM